MSAAARRKFEAMSDKEWAEFMGGLYDAERQLNSRPYWTLAIIVPLFLIAFVFLPLIIHFGLWP